MNEGQLQERYANRFSASDRKRKDGIWYELCRHLVRKYGEKERMIVDVAAGSCEFINNYPLEEGSECVRVAFDANPDVEKYAGEGVRAICDTIEHLPEHLEKGSVTLFFMSNFLEHITRDAIDQLFKDEHDLLADGGRVMILTPNIRYSGGKYWDFFDHITPLTEKSLAEEAVMNGFEVEVCIGRFMPFSTKSRLPQAQWLVRLYLGLLPLSGMVFGEQSLLILRKGKRS